jgi:PilZ domain
MSKLLTVAQPESFPHACAGNGRASVQFPCPPQNARPARVLINNEAHDALILNFSLGGVGLLLCKRIEPGTSLRIRLGSATEKDHLELAARVIHATAKEDRFWLLGCTFDLRLSVGELRAFLV